ncbi:FecR domain-containing protein [Fulvivirgaceae bacterium PWU5]|uniref:FecR domain-containing protein n=1 Tax=Dawidia cretensis TaxID=2782350 RepID=A0AAP2E462_9BACT|nr:FecR family protein [Dawidia cretensis]MBT1711849.1 FecR domain-containing protein [Dawidia cretensis]
MTQEEFRYLLKKYKTGVATSAERELIEQWYDTLGRGELTHMSPDEELALEKQFRAHIDHYIATAAKTGKQRFLGFWQTAAIAASLLLVCVFLAYFYSPGSIPEQVTTIPVRSAEDADELVTVAATELRRVQLTDGSTVTLQPGSTLSYDAHNYNDTRREIFLQGEGFFEVARDAQRPFYVFTGEVATRVLGTSFTVKTVGSKGEIIVAVNTGRVAVATRQRELFGLKASYQQEAVLTPNQQAVFNIDKKLLSTGLVDAPQVISPETTPEQMAFDDIALAEILEDLEQAYQVDIVFDPERISACFVTAKFDKENLFERLDIICKAAGAHYVVSGAQIIISNKMP